MSTHSARMPPAGLWLVLLAIGVLLPLAAFIPWVAEQGLKAALFFEQAFANRVAAFSALDVIASALTLLVAAWVFLERTKAALVSLLYLGISVSAGLPLFFFFLEASCA